MDISFFVSFSVLDAIFDKRIAQHTELQMVFFSGIMRNDRATENDKAMIKYRSIYNRKVTYTDGRI